MEKIKKLKCPSCNKSCTEIWIENKRIIKCTARNPCGFYFEKEYTKDNYV